MERKFRKFTLVAGTGEGGSKLNSFDKALLSAGIGNVNLVKMSSILPPGVEYDENLTIPPGSLIPIAYGYTTSKKAGDRIAAAVAVGIKENSYGVIMEYSGHISKEEIEIKIRNMVEEAFKYRGLEIDSYYVKTVEHEVKKIGTAFAGLVMWH